MDEESLTMFQSNVIQAATMFKRIGLENDENVFDLNKFSDLIVDLICLRDNVLFLTNPPRNELIFAIALHVDAGGASVIEIRQLIDLFLRWNEIIQTENVIEYGGRNLPNIGDNQTVLDLTELHHQRTQPIPFRNSVTTIPPQQIPSQQLQQQNNHNNHNNNNSNAQNWMFTSGDQRGFLVPSEFFQEAGWNFHDHGDGTGFLHHWAGINTPEGQACLVQGTVQSFLIQRVGSLGAPSPRLPRNEPSSQTISTNSTTSSVSSRATRITTTENSGNDNSLHANSQTNITHSSTLLESNTTMTMSGSQDEMMADSNISMPMEEPDPRVQLLIDVDNRIQQMGGVAIEVGSGGDCFFRCLTAQHPDFNFTPSDENSLRARERVIRYLSNNADRCRNFIAYDSSIPTYDVYLERMSQPNTWIEGGLEALAAAMVWNVRIHIFGANPLYDRVIQPFEPNESTGDIYMVHYHDYHYRVFQFVNPNSESQSSSGK